MVNIIQPNNSEFSFEIFKSKENWILQKDEQVGEVNDGIHESASFHDNTIEIAGTVSGSSGGTAGIRSEGLRTDIVIDTTGTVQGPTGVIAAGNSARISNDGLVLATAAGILMSGDNARLENTGDIKAAGLGIDMRGGKGHDKLTNTGAVEADAGIVADGNVVLTNGASGEVIANHNAIKISSIAGDHAKITNVGDITSTGGHFALLGGEGAEKVVNHGTMTGQIELGGGNDVFDNRGGTIVSGIPEGVIFGNEGNDTYLVSSAVNLFEFSGEGKDTVKSTVSFTLNDNFERLFLLGKADTSATGNGGANSLRGNSGDNILDGLAGKDILSGGDGDDMFVFKTGYGKDTITDFRHGADQLDLTDFDEITSFSDLKSHHLKVSGDDLIIHAGDDSLILHNMDKSDLAASDVLI